MATGIIGEAALGAVIGEVLKVVTDVKKKALKFKPILERLESTLEFVIPKINEMVRLSQTYNYHTKKDTGIGTFELVMLLQKGEVLLHKCSRVSRWNYWKKYQYSNKLLELEASLFRFCLLNLQVEESKDIKLILVKMEELNLRLDSLYVPGRKVISRTSSAGSNISNFSWFSAEDSDGECSNGQILPASNLRVFTLSELKAATKNFRSDSVLGEGGFGRVFKGWLNENGRGSTTVIAVKKLSPESMQGFHEWQSEVNFLGGLSHPNLIKLLGYCWEDTELLLIYEFMHMGSLETLLFKRTDQPLPWDRRLKILIGAARGLAFLHTLAKPVIYRDFKTSNILLDESYTAKLSDFGLAKMGPSGDQSHVTTRVIGTYGYAAPEYIATGHLYIKSDVYGFGVVLVEMLTGLRAIDVNRPREKQNLVNWVKPYLSSRRKVKKITDVRMMGRYSSEAVGKAAHLSLKCLQSEPESRPSMEEIVEKLERIEAAKEKPH